MFNYYALKEERFIHCLFDFNILPENKGFESPYDYTRHFNINSSYSSFTRKISELLEFNVIEDEKIYLKTFFGKKIINNKYSISKIIKKKLFHEFIDSVIKCKRIEFLQDYIIRHKFKSKHLEYIDNLLISLYKTRNYLVKNIT